MENNRGNRSKFIECVCYNIDNLEEPAVWKTLDFSKPFDQYVPEYILDGIIKEIKDEKEKNYE